MSSRRPDSTGPGRGWGTGGATCPPGQGRQWHRSSRAGPAHRGHTAQGLPQKPSPAKTALHTGVSAPPAWTHRARYCERAPDRENRPRSALVAPQARSGFSSWQLVKAGAPGRAARCSPQSFRSQRPHLPAAASGEHARRLPPPRPPPPHHRQRGQGWERQRGFRGGLEVSLSTGPALHWLEPVPGPHPAQEPGPDSAGLCWASTWGTPGPQTAGAPKAGRPGGSRAAAGCGDAGRREVRKARRVFHKVVFYSIFLNIN